MIRKLVVFLLIVSGLTANSIVWAHEEGSHFSGAIIDPLRVHHAHIEDEERLNFFSIQGFRREDQEPRTATLSSLEIAASWTKDFRFGSEILIPFTNTGTDENYYGVGDIELWPLKYAFVNEPEKIWTGILSLKLPSGRRSKGLGEEAVAIGPSLFLDQSHGNWFFGFNGEVSWNISAKEESELELASVLSYSFIQGTGKGIAPTKPTQKIVPAVSLEVLSESILLGNEKGENQISVLPGINLWHPQSGWALRIGAQFPASVPKINDFMVLVQIGNHLSWNSFVRR